MGLISLWRRTLEPTDLRVELRDGNFAMGHFDTRQLALNWLTQHVADEEDRISEQLSEIADEQESVQEMRDFLTDAEEWENKTGWEGESLREMSREATER